MSLDPSSAQPGHTHPEPDHQAARRRMVGIGAAVVVVLAAGGWGITSALRPDGSPPKGPFADSTVAVGDLIGADGPATPTPDPTPTAELTPPTPTPPAVVTSGPGSTAPTTKAPPKPPATSANTGNERRIRAYVTGYSFFDNTPPGSASISNPVIHRTAGGRGTFDDPITVAVGHSISGGRDTLDWSAGTRFYLPNLRRYFIAEDTCGDGGKPQDGPCHVGFPSGASTWLDIWVGGQGGTNGGADKCMGGITDVWDVLVAPRPNYTVVAGDVYSGAGCTQQFGNTVSGG